MRHFSRGVVSCLVATLPLAACSDSTTPSIPLAEMPLRFQGGSRAIFSTLSVYVGYANPSDGVDGPMIIDTVELTGPTPAAEVRTPGLRGLQRPWPS